MRVVAGELGGRRIVAPRSGVRPSTDRLREALFSILGEVAGARVLDLFCGTGALGIEAVSRGAATATFVDLDINPARRNVEELGIADRCGLHRSDAMRFLGGDGGSYDLILCDPPYRLARRLGPKLDRLLAPRLAEGGRVIVEADATEPLELSLPIVDERRYGSTLLRIHAGGGAR